MAGKHNINISYMKVGRVSPRGRAMMVLGLDAPIPQHVLDEVRALSHVYSAKQVKM